ncbi:MAG: agmatinase, partial [Bacillota bacterium]|nr:agmatinase [Bacillota bacterium]
MKKEILRAPSQSFIGCESSLEDSRIVIFGAPFDSTTSYRPGARFAPSAIRSESFGIETYSPYLDADLADYDLFDSGDLELPFGAPEPALVLIREHAATIAAKGKIPFMIGGDHLVTLGAVEALAAQGELYILHFDAHTDLREQYLGAPLSHATVLRRCWDLVGDGKIHQFCIRSGERAEFEWAKQHTHLEKFSYSSLTQAVAAIPKGARVYLTIDLDVFDPCHFPGTGTPEAGGIGFPDFCCILHTLRGLNIVGADIVELSPHYDHTGISTALACKVTRELLLLLAQGP